MATYKVKSYTADTDNTTAYIDILDAKGEVAAAAAVSFPNVTTPEDARLAIEAQVLAMADKVTAQAWLDNIVGEVLETLPAKEVSAEPIEEP